MDAIVANLMQMQEQQAKEASALNMILKEKRQTDTALNNLMAAIEQGIISNTTNKRLHELESKQDVQSVLQIDNVFRREIRGATASFFLSDFFCFRCGYRSTVPRGSKRRKNSRLNHSFPPTITRQFSLPPLTSARYLTENIPFTVPSSFATAENGKK